MTKPPSSMKYLFNLCILLLFFCIKANAQEAKYPVINYSTKDYGREFNPSNAAIAQDGRGIIYAANGFKLLEFDGNKWKSYPINKEAWILSLSIDSSGIIYTGSQNEFGLFTPDKRGELKYKSLSDSLDLHDIDFTNIWKVHSFSGGTAFQAEEKLFLYKNGKTEVIKPETSFHTSFLVNDKLYIRQRGIGLMELKGKSLVLIKGSEIFDTTGIFLMLPFGRNNKKILIGTREKGFWLFEPENFLNHFRKFSVENAQLIEKSVITGGVVTGDGLFAISTMQNGVMLIDTIGKTKTIINKRNGLADNDVKELILDDSKNLWLALNNGISRIEISSPLSVYNEKSGITGSVNSVIRYKSLLYVGTTTGLFAQDPENESETTFKPVLNLTYPVRSLIAVKGYLLVGTDAGLFQISDKNINKVSIEESFILLYSDELNILFSGGPKGLTTYHYDGSFKKINSLTIKNEDIVGISSDPGSTKGIMHFWLATRYNGLIRVIVKDDFTFLTDRYNKADGLPDGKVVLPFTLNFKTVFGTSLGLFSFTNENIVKESLPDSLKNNKKFSKGYFSKLPDLNDGIGNSVSFIADTKNKAWICTENNVGYLDKRSNMGWVSKPFSGIDVGKINTISPEENGVCWIGTTDGLIRYDENSHKKYDDQYHTLIRKVSAMDNDSAIFLGTNFTTNSGYFKIITEQRLSLKPSFPYKNNSIRIEFSASFYEYSDKIFYSYKFENSNSRWSQWTKENFQEFTNLHEGDYTFIVKTRNVYGTEGTPAQYSFKVLPPWYRTGAAYTSYVILLFMLFWLFARVYSRHLKRENIRLEGIVTERTAEVVKQKDEIVSKNIVLEFQKKEIEDSIRYARRIQSAVIPSENDCIKLLTESFVLFRPLNIVSGDFYWISHIGNKIIFTAADCTGHGVPGAFMSMLGVAFLNEIVNKDKVTSPDVILNLLRKKVIQALQQHGLSGEARDGMDIAIVSINTEEKKLEFAGAYNPLVMIRNGEIFETAGDKMPIGIYENMDPFTCHEITIERGDLFYMSSDGYEDQFGGPDGKKFKAKNFKQLLLEIHKNPMQMQKDILEKNFDDWKGDLDQIDDVVVVGLAII
jgi:serine phosphatase RsbU (regulator of sigma subunit)